MNKKPKKTMWPIYIFLVFYLSVVAIAMAVVDSKDREREATEIKRKQDIKPAKDQEVFFSVGRYGKHLILEVFTERTNDKRERRP
jgi:hypothetical protein